MINPADLPAKVRQWGKPLKAMLLKIKAKPPKNLDDIFQDFHDETFNKIDCLNCANCCKTTSPEFFEKDIERLSRVFKMKPGAFIEKYLFLDTDGIYALKSAPCPFLGSDNYCSVYDDRPKACREFPHTNHRKMHTYIHLAGKNAEICPAVFEILSKIEVSKEYNSPIKKEF
jgi:Fe-S-cluster containining protein